jgi:hypothetical protein
MQRYAYLIIAASTIALTYLIASNNFATENSIAQVNNQTSELFITGNAITNVRPDKANIILTLETEGETASKAASNNSAIMSKVTERLNELGIKADDIKTNYYTIEPIYEQVQVNDKACIEIYPPPADCYKQKLVGYKAINSISVTVDANANIGLIIDESVKNGINRVDNIYFFVSNELNNKTMNELIENAVKDAKSKAEIALKPLNMHIIGVKSIYVNTYPIYNPQPLFAAQSGINVREASTPIFPGEQQLSVSVNVTFQIA